MAVGRIGADHQDDVGLLDGIEILRPRRSAERGLEAVAGRRMADAGAGVDVVVAEDVAHQLLDEIGFFIRAARRGDAAQRGPSILLLDALELGGGMGERLVPAHLAPRIGDVRADHGLQDAVLVLGIAPGEASLDAGMAVVRLAVLVRHHAHDFLAAHLGLEGAADAAIGAGGDRGVLRLADFDDGFLDQRRGRAGLHAGAAGDAFGVEEILRRAGRDARFESARADGQREGALHLLAGPHTARAHDAFGRIVGEIGIGLVFRVGQVVVAGITVAHLAQADRARHVLQLAIAVRAAGQAIERMVGDVELHHAAAQLLQPLRLRAHLHAFGDRRGARSGRAGTAVDLHQAEPAGAEGLYVVGGAELRHRDARLHRGAHDRGAFGHLQRCAVDEDAHARPRRGGRRAVVDILDQTHRATKSSGK